MPGTHKALYPDILLQRMIVSCIISQVINTYIIEVELSAKQEKNMLLQNLYSCCEGMSYMQGTSHIWWW